MFILPHYTTELNTNNLHILSTPFPGVPDLFLAAPRSEVSPCLHSTLQKGETHLGTSAAQPAQWLQVSLQSFLTYSLPKPKTRHSLTLLGSQTAAGLANTFPDREAFEDIQRQLAALLFPPGLFWLEHRKPYIVLGKATRDYQAKTNHCDLLA